MTDHIHCNKVIHFIYEIFHVNEYRHEVFDS